MLIKRTQCRACGAPKLKRPATAYVYCDFCGVLTDWDFEVARTAPGMVIPHAYEDLTKKLAPQLEEAKAAGDRAKYHALQAELYDVYATLCPAGFSPRVNDPEYRKRFVDYTAATCVVQDFDPDFPALAAAVTTTMGQLKWDTTNGAMRVTPATFWPMWNAFCARIDKSMELNESSGLLAQHPDGAPRALLRTFGLSAMVQGWLAYLDDVNRARLLAESGLAGDYIEAQIITFATRTCGNCGCAVEVADGAKRVVCDGCGHLLEVGTAEAPCNHCGKSLTWPAGKTMLPCPSCKSELRAMKNAYD